MDVIMHTTRKLEHCALVLFLLCFGFDAGAQTAESFTRNSRNDISAGFGWMLPMVQGQRGADCSEGTMVRIDYRHFYGNRAGFGIGAQHVRGYMDVDGCFGMPMSFVCRTGLHDFDELVGKGLRNVIDNDPFEGYDEYYMQECVDNPFSQWFLSDVWTFLFSFVNRAEFRAGLTPGYIYGDGRTYPSSYGVSAGGERYFWSGVKGTEVSSRFCLTADVGATLSYRIWHFCINLSPEFHYILTDSYRLYEKPDGGIAETTPQRWQFSMIFSLNLML